MYFNNIHILYYVAIAFIGLIVGKFVAWSTYCFTNGKKIFSKEFFKVDKEGIEKNYICMIIMAIIYIFLLYNFNIYIGNEWLKNIELIKFMILTPMLVVAFFVDIKKRIIPNRLNLTIFEIGLIISFIYGINNVNMAKDYILGMIAGTLIFSIITIIGFIIYGKESMGLGDVKFIASLGLYYGVTGIAEISLLSFIIGAICSILLIIVRLIMKKEDEYTAFGPYIAVSSFIIIFLTSGTVIEYFMMFCKMLADKIMFL